MMNTFTQPHIIAAGIWIFLVAILGGLFTEIGPWYYSLKQPSWKPPDWAFGVVWTVIFIFAGVAWDTAWENTPSENAKWILALFFIANGLLNILWSWLYFKMHRPDWSMIEAIFLWLSVLAIILTTISYSKLAAILMIPYLVWVSIAMRLNFETIRLNGPFTSLGNLT